MLSSKVFAARYGGRKTMKIHNVYLCRDVS